MARSPAALDFDQLQKGLKPLMKRCGFKVRGRTFNRTTDDGLTQVVSLQMGASDPPGTTYIPGLRENLHGWFTVNLGVYVPEVARHHGGGEAGAFVQEYHCCVRARLGEVGPERKDLWWKITSASSLLEEIEARLQRDALPYLDRHASRDAVLRACRKSTGALGSAGSPARIVAAIILAERGDEAGARALLARQAQERRNPGHPAYVRSLADKLGLGALGAGSGGS